MWLGLQVKQRTFKCRTYSQTSIRHRAGKTSSTSKPPESCSLMSMNWLLILVMEKHQHSAARSCLGPRSLGSISISQPGSFQHPESLLINRSRIILSFREQNTSMCFAVVEIADAGSSSSRRNSNTGSKSCDSLSTVAAFTARDADTSAVNVIMKSRNLRRFRKRLNQRRNRSIGSLN